MRSKTIITDDLIEIHRYDYRMVNKDALKLKSNAEFVRTYLVTQKEAERLVNGNFTKEKYFYWRFDLLNP